MILPFSPHRLSRWTALLVFAACCPDAAIANQVSTATVNAHNKSVRFGIEGHYRVGCWTGIRAGAPFTSIETRDGDGVQVAYRQPVATGTNQWGYVIPGSEAAPVVLRDEEKVVASMRFPTIGSPSRGAAMIPLKTPWIVVFGDALGVDRIGANALLNRDPTIAVSMPSQADGVPDSVLGYDGVDMMMIGSSSADLLHSLSGQQKQAIVDWIHDGGRMFLTLGESSADLLEGAPWLRALLPIDEITTTRIDPSALETYTSSQTPLQDFVGARLPKNKGKVLILGRTTRRVSIPIAVDYIVGFGRITVVAADLEADLFASWPERLDLVTELTGTLLVPEKEEQRQKSRATAYDDLAGQLRLTLDQFASKRRFGFSLLSLMLMALIAAIGPLDFLLINRLLGRPLLGWLSFPLMAIGLSVLLAVQARPVTGSGNGGQQDTGDTLQCNRIEIFDIDSIEGIGRGFVVSYMYGHEAHLFDLDVTQDDTLRAVADGTKQMLTVPFGYPGISFGGIQIQVEDARLPVYDVEMTRTASGQGSQLRTAIQGLPLASRSSKGIATQCRFTPKLAEEFSLEHRPGSELLRGELVNPLPLDLLGGMLVYRNWAYLLPTRFPAGSRIEDVGALRQKNFRWLLSRQQALESSSETEEWNPLMSNSSDRVAEMLMFHNAVGGSRYTGLRNDPLSFLDISHVLANDRCVLVGRVAKPFTTVEVTDQQSHQPTGERLSLIRVVLPVQDR